MSIAKIKAIIAKELQYLRWKLLEDEMGGFVIDMLKGSPEVQQANLIQPISSANAQQDYQRLIQAAGLAQGQAGRLDQGQQSGLNAQNTLLNALQMQLQGQGPSLAQASLNNATGANIAQTAALMAGGRGNAQNPGMAARQIGMAGANIQQQAAGQGAQLQAQEQLAAQQMLGQQANQMVGQGLQGTQIANAAAMQPIAALGQQNQANLGNASQANQAAQAGYGSSVGLMGKIIGGAGSAMGMADGGKVPGKAPVPGDSEENDVVPTLLSPGEIVIPRSFANDPKAAAAFAHACALFTSKGKG